MIIDFHTHIWPDKVAAKALPALEKAADTVPFTNGTAADLMRSMKEAGVDRSIVLPVVTNPEKTNHINRRAAEINEKTEETGIFSFGGMHPDTPDMKAEIRACDEMGLKGIKLHPDYYGVPIQDIRMKRLISEACEYGLIVITHAGMDIGLYPPVCCTVEGILEVLSEVQPEKFVLAHMGGWMNWQEVTEKLAGKNICLDTAFSIGEIAWHDPAHHKPYHMMPDAEFPEMVRAFGPDRILFATDSPWADQKDYVERIRKMPLPEAEKEMIFSGNARRLLDW